LKKTYAALLVLLLASSLAVAQSRETGAITGRVTDDQGAPLPGVGLSLSGPALMGVRATVSDANGDFRYPALPPGIYSVKAELSGFGTLIQENIRLTTTTTLTLTLVLKPTAVQEQVTVVAQSPTVDVKSTETASVTLSNEILRNIPNSQFSANIVLMAPGVNDNAVAYGAGGERGISYQMDGVGVGDPDGGTAWVFVDYNIIEEAKVMGIGLPAEYGNFTGVIFNIVTKSGGNQFQGHFESIYQGYKKGFCGTNNNGAYVRDWPDITPPVESLWDINGHLGGPFIKDKLWFFAGAQWYNSKDYPTGFPFAQNYKQPRFFLKLSSQVTPKLNISAAAEWDNYNGTYRNAGVSSQFDPIATTRQVDPEIVLNFNLTQVLSSKTFFDVKAAYFKGYYNLEPMSGNFDVNGHYILYNEYYDPDATGTPSLDDPATLAPHHRYFNVWAYEEHPRDRFQANASLTTYAEDFLKGSHDFKFGVEFEKSYSRNLYRYTGANHWYYYDQWDSYYGYYGNYSAVQYVGYNSRMHLQRFEGFAQDSWQIAKRLNLSLGVRFSQLWGSVPGIEGSPYNKSRLAPRLGFTFDLLGDKTTILKGHYGEFTDGIYAGMFDRLNTDWSDKITWAWDPSGLEWYEWSRDIQGTWVIDPEIKQPFMRQWTIGVERELFKDASFSVTYINRSYHNFQGAWNDDAVYTPVETEYSVWDPASQTMVDRTFTLYDRADADQAHWHLTDVDVITQRFNEMFGLDLKAYRKYWGIEVLFNKRFSNRWQMVASYVYSKAKGTMGNSSAYRDIGWNSYGDPNFWINADGYVTNDPRHMIKIQASYILPFEISLNAYFHGITGEAWTQQRRTGSHDFSQGRITFNVEPSGTYHYPMAAALDLRLEKTFALASKYKLGLFFDVFNVFNAGTVSSWGTRIGYDWVADDPEYSPSTQGHDLYGLVLPRRARIGMRFTF
jgi:outer membrane receptor protein involved in Fe transport